MDLPPTKVKAGDEDEHYFLKVQLGEKDGKRVGVAYIGEKLKDQSQKDYSQIFIDLDDKQVRFDKSNQHPIALLSRVTVEFPDQTVKIKQESKK